MKPLIPFAFNLFIASISGAFFPEHLNSLSLQPDGKIVAAGAFFDEFTGMERVALARFLPDGSLDMSFGQEGKVLPAIPGFASRLHQAVIQPDGRVLAAGYSTFLDPDLSNDDLLLARFLPDGTPDTGFGNNGVGSTVRNAR